ncbi:DUF1205 domain-containing protein [Streptomyces sp. N2-109]|uniref:DUF1205 domain-containing protein n=1 Tax=Streptomyces gossypii TaxID=2883101 RepID=A0ABT2K1B7_9ACTN|nr:nucleotide disphospho-sugar-binding domain-containing protein [Streptomyces gossypii]MCT2593259.1 DUF1205 domain-containing protein [Streptomyces gossypii]
MTMRYLFTTTPGFSHTTPMVPLAYAAQLAGHQVLFAAGGPALRAGVGAGLPAVDVAPGADLTQPYAELAATAGGTDLSVQETERLLFSAFGTIGELMLDGLVETAREWRADAVVYPPMLPAALLAARAAGCGAVLHGIGLRHPVFPWPEERFAAAARRYGVTELPRHPDAELSLGPDSLEKINPTAPEDDGTAPPLVPMYPSPYNGGGEIPGWALDEDRPRIVVTMGSVPEHSGQRELLSTLMTATADLEVEVLVTSGGADLPALLGPLPEHVRPVDFVPLSTLLPTCDAVVHHGGMGTMFAALAAGLPQVCLPTTKGDALTNSQVTEQRGAGLTLDPVGLTGDEASGALRAVLSTPSYRKVSEEVSAEMRTMPSPPEAVSHLTALLT